MKVSAHLLGERFHIKKVLKLSGFKVLRRDPLCIENKTARIIIFKFGVAVFIQKTAQVDHKLLERLQKCTENPTVFGDVPSETVSVKINSQKDDVGDGVLRLSEYSEEFENVLATVLARSVVIERYENRIEKELITFEEVLHSFEKTGRPGLSSRHLLRMSGRSMALRNSIVSRLSLLDKPDFTWDDSYLDEWHQRLDDEYEISARYKILSKKIDTIFGDVEFILNYLESRKMYLLELAIVLLFVLDIIVLFMEYI